MAASKTSPKKKTKSAKVHPAMTPLGYLVTGLAMWLMAYLIAILALQSGSLFQWLAALVALIWGLVRILEGIHKAFKRK